MSSLWCLAFYSASGCKRPGYILPALPPLALWLGYDFHRLLPESGGDGELWRQGFRLAFRASVTVVLLGLGMIVVVTLAGLISTGTGLLLAGLTAIAGAAVIARAHSGVLAWTDCGLLTFAVLLVGVAVILPTYARKYSLRDQIAPFESLDESIPVVCYPHAWDSVACYLRRDDVRVFAAAERVTLLAQLKQSDATLVFVKSDHSLRALLHDLPASVEFLTCSRRPSVTVGWVRRRRKDG